MKKLKTMGNISTIDQKHIMECVNELNTYIENNKEFKKDELDNIVKTHGFTSDKLSEIRSKDFNTDLEKMLLNYADMIDTADISSAINKVYLTEKNELKNIEYYPPTTLSMPTPKPVEEIFGGKDLSELTNIVVSAAEALEEFVVPTQVVIVQDDDPALKTNRKLTAFDRAVFNGICTIIKAGNTFFTPKQVYQAMGGILNPRKEVLVRINSSIMKMRATFLSIDWIQHLKMKSIDPPTDMSVKTDSAMLSLIGTNFKLSGKEVSGYKVQVIPPLLTYSDMVNQICTIDKHMIDAPIQKKEENITLIQFLARLINYNKIRNPGTPIKVSYKVIFSKIGIDITKTERRKRYRCYETVKTILEYWKQEKYIRGYAEIFDSRGKAHGISIDFYESQNTMEKTSRKNSSD